MSMHLPGEKALLVGLLESECQKDSKISYVSSGGDILH